MTPDTPLDARLREQAAHQAAANAHLRLFLALDDAMSYGGIETFRLPTQVLIALDAAREAEASIFSYLPEPGITSQQVHDALAHAIATVEEMTGPTQDQEPTIEQQRDTEMQRAFLDGFLTVDEYNRLLKQVEQDPRLGICQECGKLCVPGYLFHSECFHKEGADFEQAPREEQIVDLPAGEPAFQDENGLPIPF